MNRGVDFIGVGCVFVCHDGQGNILLHKRSANCRDEQGRWDCGAGSMEFGESFEETVRREVREEYGAEPIELSLAEARSTMREHDGTPTHWVHIVYVVRVDPAQVTIGEPEKIDEIGWFALDALPNPPHSQLDKAIAALRNHYASFS